MRKRKLKKTLIANAQWQRRQARVIEIAAGKRPARREEHEIHVELVGRVTDCVHVRVTIDISRDATRRVTPNVLTRARDEIRIGEYAGNGPRTQRQQR